MKPNTESQTPSQPTVTRRKAVGTGVAIAAGSLLTSEICAMQMDLSRSRDESKGRGRRRSTSRGLAVELAESHWANMVGHQFAVRGTAGSDESADQIAIPGGTKLRLVDTRESVTPATDEARPTELKRRFATSLVFASNSRFEFGARTYRLFHPWLGEFEFFLSPTSIKKYRNQNVYEAVLNN